MYALLPQSTFVKAGTPYEKGHQPFPSDEDICLENDRQVVILLSGDVSSQVALYGSMTTCAGRFAYNIRNLFMVVN